MICKYYLCSVLTSVTIGNGVTSIGGSVFGYCSELTSIVVENGNPIFDSRDGCNAIIETSSNTLFLGCKGTIIPNSVTSIGEDAFRFCSGLTSVTIPNSVTSIKMDAFEYCSELTSVTIGNGVTYIGNDAFYGCSGLTSVTIGNSVTSITFQAFYGCNGLTSVTSLNTTPPQLSYLAFSNYNATLYVPIGCRAIYWVADYWKKFKNIVEIDASNIQNTLTEKVDSTKDKYYNLQGQRVFNPKNGVYIKNGKKVFIK